MKNLNNIIRKLRGSVISRMDKEEKGTSEPEEEIEELHCPSKEHKKSKEYMQKLWWTMKDKNLLIIGIDEQKESHVNDKDHISSGS